MSCIYPVTNWHGVRMDLDIIKEWSKNPEELSTGMNSTAVLILQEILNSFKDIILVPGCDGNFWHRTEHSVKEFQKARAIEVTGRVDSFTRLEFLRCIEENWPTRRPFKHSSFKDVSIFGAFHPLCGEIPESSGSIGVFGGASLFSERSQSLAYISDFNSPGEMLSNHSTLVKMGVFRNGLESLDSWPVIPQMNGSHLVTNSSWALSEKGYYCAMRWTQTNNADLKNEFNPKIFIWNEEKRLGVVCMRVDWGPGKYTGRAIDVSSGALNSLDLPAGANVKITWASDDAELGEYYF